MEELPRIHGLVSENHIMGGSLTLRGWEVHRVHRGRSPREWKGGQSCL